MFAIVGCEWGNARRVVVEPDVPGLAEMSYDGLNLHLESDPASGMELRIGGQRHEAADLRLGGRFGLTDGRHLHDYYQVMLLTDDQVTLKHTRFVDRQLQREGYSRSERVVAVAPYGGGDLRAAPEPGDSPRP